MTHSARNSVLLEWIAFLSVRLRHYTFVMRHFFFLHVPYKKLSAALFVVVGCVALAACSNSGLPTLSLTSEEPADTTGPTAPTAVTLGAVPSNLTNSPTISYTAGVDVGTSTVDHHEVRIERTSDNSTIRDWATHVSGADVGGLSLVTNTSYTVLVRAVDAVGNLGTVSTPVTFTDVSEACYSTIGSACTGGAIYLGVLSPGAATGTGTDRYMTTPGGCGEIPAGQRVGAAGPTSYPNADFTPTCSGTDFLIKTWDDGNGTAYDIPAVGSYTQDYGDSFGATNIDANYGSTNTTNIVAITDPAQGGYHAAARYCDKLSYGGYTDWHLPNRYELNLFNIHKALIPGLDVSGLWYWSSTEYGNMAAWDQRFDDGYQLSNGMNKSFSTKSFRCVRRF